MKVEFFRHNIGEEEIQEVADALRGVFLTTGPRTKSFESAFADYLGVGATVGTTSWTQAAFLALKAWDIGPGDEVILPVLSFVATANVVLHCGATPVFVDSEPSTGNLDLERVVSAITPRTKVIIPVHLYGNLVDMRALKAIADSRGIRILEDAAHSIEGMRDGYRPGFHSDAACFSFYATKNITSGEGGALATNDPALADRLGILRMHGLNRGAAERYTSRFEHWDAVCLGYKANMNDLQAALLKRQLEKIEVHLDRRESIARYYEQEFEKAQIAFPKVPKCVRSARHLFTVWAQPEKRDQILLDLQSRGIGVAVNFRPIHLLSYYREKMGLKPGAFPVAEEIGSRTISIPLYPKLSDEERDYVALTVISLLR